VVELSSGVGPRDRVIDNPPDSLSRGDTVRVARTGSAAAIGKQRS